MENNEEKLPALNLKQEAFIHEWFKNGFNGKAAYMSVYQNVKPASAEQQASRLLKLPQAQLAISAIQDQIRKKENIDKGEIVQTLKRMIAKCEAEDDKSNLLKAIEQLSKIGRLYSDSPQVNIASQGDVQISFGGWNPDVDAEVSNYINDYDDDNITTIVPENDPQ